MARHYMDTILPAKLKNRKYHDAAYVEGYIDGLTYLIAEDDIRQQIPMYYAFGEERLVRTLKDYRRVLARASRVSPREHKFARQLIHKHAAADGIVPHHTPFLL